MKHFKKAWIVTGIVLPVMLLAGILASIWISNLGISNRMKSERVAALGAGVATLTCIIIAPFWLTAAAKLGKERRRKSRR